MNDDCLAKFSELEGFGLIQVVSTAEGTPLIYVPSTDTYYSILDDLSAYTPNREG